ncbi:MAG: T9SS type A sorting domain-containing protein, partial [Candidatus Krumholzibacteria bacterium]|nr:T9SS type A sorting domain-containing protein [Candidatus Krumholzibacteria bacterium]
TLNVDSRWSCMGTRSGTVMGIPFFVGADVTINAGRTLTIDGGVTVKFYRNTGLNFNGYLDARGSAEKNVVFTSYLDILGQPEPTATNYWDQIVFNIDSGGVLEFCTIRFAGYDYHDVIVTDFSSPIIQHVDIAKCRRHLIRAQNTANPVVHYSSLVTNNTTYYGVYGDCTSTVDATSNYWGASSGPYHATLNPSGTGSRVGDCVLFEPFWDNPYGTPEIAVHPGALGATLEPEWTTVLDLYIMNLDTASVLSYSISEALAPTGSFAEANGSESQDLLEDGASRDLLRLADVEWLSVDRPIGLVDRDDTMTVKVTFAAGSLECGSYTAYLIIGSNDEDEDPVIVPVCMFVKIDHCDAPDSPPVGEFHLSQNYPNPFNPQTTFSYYLPQQDRVLFVIYDASGRKVRTLISGVQPQGRHTIDWAGNNDREEPVASGVYFARFLIGDKVTTRKLILAR